MSVQEALASVGSANDITVLRTDNYDQNTQLIRIVKEQLKTPIKHAEKQQSQMVDLKSILTAAKNNERKEIKDNEKEPKKYALLQRYGHILEKIENLIDIINFDFEDLSFDNLGDEIKKLVKTRKINERQITFEYYQELFVSTTDSLMIIEEGFENGDITADEALAQIKALKLDFIGNQSEVPEQFKQSKGDVMYLLNMYEQAFCTAKAPAFTAVANPFQLNDAIKIQLQELNLQTKQLQQSTETLYKKVSEFEPVVDLSALCTQLRDVDNFFKDDWEVDPASYKVSALESSVDHLYNDQLYKNKTREGLSNEIKNLTNSTSELTKKTQHQMTLRQFDNSNTRAQAVLNRLPKLTDMIDGGKLPEDFAAQMGNCYNNAVQEDKDISLELAEEIGVSSSNLDIDLNTLTQDELYKLQDYIKTKSLESSPGYNNRPEDGEEEPSM